METCKDCGLEIEFDEDLEKWFDKRISVWFYEPYFHYHKPKGKTLATEIVVTYKSVAEQLMRANEALVLHGHDPNDCDCGL